MPVKDKARSKKISNLMREAGLICGAKARSNGGQPCKNTPYSLATGNGRCRYHGGMGNSGAKTAEGLQRIRDAMKAYWVRRKAAASPQVAVSPPVSDT